MLAVGQEREIGIKAVGQRVTVPNDDRGHLMYYLHCVLCCMPEMKSVFSDHNLDFLSNYGNYYLDAEDVQKLIVFCVALNPLENGVPVFPVPNGHALLGGFSNEFYEITDTRKLTALLAGQSREFTGVAIIQGREVRITKFMIASESWFHTHYLGPLERLVNRYLRQPEQRRVEYTPAPSYTPARRVSSHKSASEMRQTLYCCMNLPWIVMAVGCFVPWSNNKSSLCVCTPWACSLVSPDPFCSNNCSVPSSACEPSGLIAIKIFAGLAFALACAEVANRCYKCFGGGNGGHVCCLCTDLIGLVCALISWIVGVTQFGSANLTAGYYTWLGGGLIYFIFGVCGNFALKDDD